MIIGQTVLNGLTCYSPWFRRQGDGATLAIVVTGSLCVLFGFCVDGSYLSPSVLGNGLETRQQDPRITAKFENAELLEIIHKIVPPDRNVLVAVSGRVSVELQPKDLLVALGAVAAPLGAVVTIDEYDVLSIARPRASKGGGKWDERALKTLGMERRAAILAVADIADLNVIVGRGIEGKVTREVGAADWRAALRRIAPGALIRERAGVVMVLGEPPQGGGTIRCDFRDTDAATVLKSIGHDAGRQVEVDASITDRITLRLSDVPWRHALNLVSETVGAEMALTEDSRYVFRKPAPPRDIESAMVALAQPNPPFLTTAAAGMQPEEVCRLIAGLSHRSVTLAADVDSFPIVCRTKIGWRQLLRSVADMWRADIIELDNGDIRVVDRQVRK